MALYEAIKRTDSDASEGIVADDRPLETKAVRNKLL